MFYVYHCDLDGQSWGIWRDVQDFATLQAAQDHCEEQKVSSPASHFLICDEQFDPSDFEKALAGNPEYA